MEVRKYVINNIEEKRFMVRTCEKNTTQNIDKHT